MTALVSLYLPTLPTFYTTAQFTFFNRTYSLSTQRSVCKIAAYKCCYKCHLNHLFLNFFCLCFSNEFLA